MNSRDMNNFADLQFLGQVKKHPVLYALEYGFEHGLYSYYFDGKRIKKLKPALKKYHHSDTFRVTKTGR